MQHEELCLPLRIPRTVSYGNPFPRGQSVGCLVFSPCCCSDVCSADPEATGRISFTTCSQLHELAKTCDRQHEHETWTIGQYHMACRKVAPDVAYDQTFSAAIAAFVAHACLLLRDVGRAPPVKEDVASLTAVARQHRAAPQRLIPEFTHVLTVSVCLRPH